MAEIQLDLIDEVLKEGVEWSCAQCHLCSDRCPRDVDPANIIVYLQNSAVQGGFTYPRTLNLIVKSLHSIGFMQEAREVIGRDFEVYDRESLGLPRLKEVRDEDFRRALRAAEDSPEPWTAIKAGGSISKRVGESMEGGLALYLGCTIPTEQYSFELSSREVLKALEVDYTDVEGFSCCGYPVRGYSLNLWLYLSSRNLSIAEGEGLHILPLCNGCYFSLREAKALLDSSQALRRKVNSILGFEGLEYRGRVEIYHLLDVLQLRAGDLKSESLKGFRFAAHYGCHALRPSELAREEAEEPKTLDELIEAIGAMSVDYPEKLDCCGASLILSQPEAAYRIAGLKLQSLRGMGVDGLIDLCPFCHRMYDGGQEAIRNITNEDVSLPVLYYTQLLGIVLGVEAERLGLSLNLSPLDPLLERMGI